MSEPVLLISIFSGMMFNNKDVGIWPCQGKGGTQFWMMSLSGGFYLSVRILGKSFNSLGELRRDDTCLEFTGKGVRLKNMRCSKDDRTTQV